MKRVCVAVLVLFAVSISSAKAAQQMAIWDFGPNAGGYTTNPTAENLFGIPTLVLSGGTLDPDGKDGVAYLDAAGVSHLAGQSGAWDELKISGNNAKWIVSFDTTGWTDISVRFDYKTWSTKTTSMDMDYRLNDADPWTSILNNQTINADGNFHTFSYSVASLDAIENKPLVEFRFNDLDNKGTGKFAIDNFELTGTQTPEPATLMLLGLGAGAMARRRSK